MCVCFSHFLCLEISFLHWFLLLSFVSRSLVRLFLSFPFPPMCCLYCTMTLLEGIPYGKLWQHLEEETFGNSLGSQVRDWLLKYLLSHEEIRSLPVTSSTQPSKKKLPLSTRQPQRSNTSRISHRKRAGKDGEGEVSLPAALNNEVTLVANESLRKHCLGIREGTDLAGPRYFVLETVGRFGQPGVSPTSVCFKQVKLLHYQLGMLVNEDYLERLNLV